MTDAEIARSYSQAPEGQKQKQIRILSELNACDKKKIREILRSQGFYVREPKNRWTAAKEEGKTTDCKDCAMGEICGYGKPDGARCDAFEPKGSDGSEVSARLLKSEEPTGPIKSEEQTGPIKSEEQTGPIKSEEQTGPIKSDESEDVGTCQQEVGTMSEHVSRKSEQCRKRSLHSET